ncbi:MAG: hypothetical protein K0R61_4418 [Microvirga sp.]|jgi:hypothetical protein|nr:hypothetical protein [Microvirga sp.]
MHFGRATCWSGTRALFDRLLSIMFCRLFMELKLYCILNEEAAEAPFIVLSHTVRLLLRLSLAEAVEAWQLKGRKRGRYRDYVYPLVDRVQHLIPLITARPGWNGRG